MSIVNTFKNQSSVQLEATSKLDYEDFVIRWKLNIFTPTSFDREDMDSPVFVGGERGQHSWKLQWKVSMDHGANVKRYTYGVKVFLVSIGDSNFATNNELRACATIAFKEPLSDEDSAQKSLSFESVRVNRSLDTGTRLTSSELYNKRRGYIVNNILTIYCKIYVKCEAKHSAIFKTVLPPFGSSFRVLKNGGEEDTCQHSKGLIQAIKRALVSTDFADVHLVTRTKTLSAHKVILAARSPVFAAMFRTNMVEASQNSVNILDFDADVVEAMLEFIYSGSTERLIEFCGKLLEISDKYELLDLKEECEHILISNLTIQNAADTLLQGNVFSAAVLKAAAMNFISGNKKKVITTDSFKELVTFHPEILFELFSI